MSETLIQPEIEVERNTVLLGEDDSFISGSVTDILGILGYEVLLAKDGESLITIFASEKHRIALIITDNSMPVMTGVEALPELRAIDSNVPIILYSAATKAIDCEGLLASGLINGLLSKPFEVEDLYSIVQETLDHTANREP